MTTTKNTETSAKSGNLFKKLIGLLGNDRSRFIWGLVAVLIPTVIFCTILSTKTMPAAEGWYSVYAKLINGGQDPYADFELLFMPLYAYIITGITAVFGYDIIVLRIFGILIFAGIAAITYCIFCKLFRPWISAIVSVASVIYMQSEIVQIFYDYIRVFDLFAYAATLLLLSYVGDMLKNPDGKKISVQLIVSGVLASASFLVRQNSGAFVIAYTFVLLVFLMFYRRQVKPYLGHIIQYVASAAAPLALTVLVMILNGSLFNFLNSTVGGAIDSKGGLLTVLFAWIPRAFNSIFDELIYFICGALILLVSWFATKKLEKDKDRHHNYISVILFLVCFFVGFIVCWMSVGAAGFFEEQKVPNAPYLVFAVAVSLFIISLVWLLRNRWLKEEYQTFPMMVFVLSGMIIALAYGSATSSGISEGQSALAVGLFLGLILHYSNHKYGRANKILALVLACLMCFNIFAYKFSTPYAWWGLVEPDLRTATETVEVEGLEGIKVSPDTKRGIERIVAAVDKYTDEGDNIFVLPHAPIFYLLTEHYPTTYTIVQWFDVSSDTNVRLDAEEIRESKPKVIVNFHIDEGIVGSHEKLFRGQGESGLRTLTKTINQMAEEGTYVLMDYFRLQGYPVMIYVLAE